MILTAFSCHRLHKQTEVQLLTQVILISNFKIKLAKLKMENLPGVLFYEISRFAELEAILLMELFSIRIRNKLHGN